jgi:hypothetical protein
MFENLIIYGAVYDNRYAALVDLERFEGLDKRLLVGAYDAAVIDVRDELPHVVKRMARPTLELIPELVGRGRPPIGVLPEPLQPGEAALAAIGVAELETAFEQALSRARMTSVRRLEPSAL